MYKASNKSYNTYNIHVHFDVYIFKLLVRHVAAMQTLTYINQALEGVQPVYWTRQFTAQNAGST